MNATEALSIKELMFVIKIVQVISFILQATRV